MDHNLPGSSVQGVLPARTPDWVAISSYGGSFDPGIKPMSSVLTGRFFTTEPPEIAGQGTKSHLPSDQRQIGLGGS